MVLDSFVILNGTLSLIVVISSFLAGILILHKYRKYKQKTFLYVGFTSIGLLSFWWPSSLSFLIALFDDVGLQPYPSVYFVIMVLLSAPTVISWMLALDSLMEKRNKWRKFLIILISLEVIFFELIFIIIAVLNPLYIGDLISPVDIYLFLLGLIFFINAGLIISLVTISFSLNSMKSPLPEIRLKAILILISGMLFLVCTFADGIIHLNIIALTVIRLLLILTVFIMYCGFHLPNFLKKILLK
ncbi:MAG: hypothetical protein ACFFBP_13930 [Promethearchaeota archaeon]